jgi:hypothetical protein
MTDDSASAAAQAIVRRAHERFAANWHNVCVATDHFFAKLMVGQWIFAILVALTFSPYGWEGKVKNVHMHVWIALVLGAVIASLPIVLALQRPGWVGTRHVIAVAQMMFSGLLIHLSGGRIETHFHIFGSFGILAFYRDWPILVTASAVTGIDHIVRGIVWPESIYGILSPEWWRFLEHVFWVLFAAIFLSISCLRSLKEMRTIAERGAEIEALAEGEWRKSSVVDRDAAAATA